MQIVVPATYRILTGLSETQSIKCLIYVGLRAKLKFLFISILLNIDINVAPAQKWISALNWSMLVRAMCLLSAMFAVYSARFVCNGSNVWSLYTLCFVWSNRLNPTRILVFTFK